MKNIYINYKTVGHFEPLKNLISASKDANSRAKTAGTLSSCQQGCKPLIPTLLQYQLLSPERQ